MSFHGTVVANLLVADQLKLFYLFNMNCLFVGDHKTPRLSDQCTFFFFFFFNCMFYQLLRVQHSCSSTQSWGSVLPSIGGQTGVVVTRPHGKHQDVGSNLAAARNEKQTLGGPPTEGSPMVQQDLNGRPAM